MSERERAEELLNDVSSDNMGRVVSAIRAIVDAQTDEEKIEVSARKVLKKYHRAFEVLAR